VGADVDDADDDDDECADDDDESAEVDDEEKVADDADEECVANDDEGCNADADDNNAAAANDDDDDEEVEAACLINSSSLPIKAFFSPFTGMWKCTKSCFNSGTLNAFSGMDFSSLAANVENFPSSEVNASFASVTSRGAVLGLIYLDASNFPDLMQS
jgi:hypothetical protein